MQEAEQAGRGAAVAAAGGLGRERVAAATAVCSVGEVHRLAQVLLPGQ